MTPGVMRTVEEIESLRETPHRQSQAAPAPAPEPVPLAEVHSENPALAEWRASKTG